MYSTQIRVGKPSVNVILFLAGDEEMRKEWEDQLDDYTGFFRGKYRIIRGLDEINEAAVRPIQKLSFRPKIFKSCLVQAAESIAGSNILKLIGHRSRNSPRLAMRSPYNGSFTAHVCCDHKFSSAIFELF